jgi:hypothetical protein
MSNLSKNIGELSQDERELLELLLLEEDGGGPDAFGLSYAQRRLWFLDQLEPGSPAFNIATAVRLRGPLDVATFGRSLNEIVRRHETLRTTFSTDGGRPVQVVAPSLELTLEVSDLPRLPESGRESVMLRLAAE